jgi:hypothetical protein
MLGCPKQPHDARPKVTRMVTCSGYGNSTLAVFCTFKSIHAVTSEPERIRFAEVEAIEAESSDTGLVGVPHVLSG